MRGRCPGLAGAEELTGFVDGHREHLADVAAAEVVLDTEASNRLPSHTSQVLATVVMIARSV